MNQHRDLVKELTHIIHMQGAHVENTFTALDGEKETEAQVATRKKEEEERVCNEVLNAERIGAERVREISDQRLVSDMDRHAKNRAYVEATFGEIRGDEEDENRPGALRLLPSMLDIRCQRKFRELCAITTYADFFSYVNDLLVGDPFDLDRDRHEPAERLGMYNILKASGFASPFDDAAVEITPDKRRKLADAIGALNMIKSSTQTTPTDPIKSASALLAGQWLVRPKQHAKKGADANKYSLVNSAILKKYGTLPAPRHLVRYKAFTDALNPAFHSKTVTPTEFRAFTTPT